MGLDKKPSPPPKRVKEDAGREESVASQKDAPEMETQGTERTGEEPASHSETSQPQDMDTQVQEETAAEDDKTRDGIMAETPENNGTAFADLVISCISTKSLHVFSLRL